MKKGLIGYYDYTVVLTYCGLIFAVTGIFLAFSGAILAALTCLMISGICDVFDGTVAHTKERSESERCFGIQIDSLSDLVSFGVLPGMIVYCMLDYSIAAGVVSAVFILCALIRLAYFNVLEAERQQQTTERRSSYLGLPVTTIAILLPLVHLFYYYGLFSAKIVFPILLLIVAAFFVAPINVTKPHGSRKAVLCVFGLIVLGLTIFQMVSA